MITYSIVVPIYKTEKLLDECVNSVLRQKSASEYELILVDDGSPDRSGQMCDEYAQRYPFVRVIHQENQGDSVARNNGVKAARGRYVFFLDSDDYWADDLLSCVEPFVEKEPDLIQFGYQRVYSDGSRDTVMPAIADQGISGCAYLDGLFRKSEMPLISSCACAFRREFLLDHNITFPAGVTFAHDFDFRMQCLKAAKSIWFVDRAPYQYRIHGESTTHVLSAKKITDLLSTCVKMYRLYPCAALADYYCMHILWLAYLKREDAPLLKPLLDENRDILDHISGKKPRIARVLYRVLGWYNGAKLVQTLVSVRHSDQT